VRYLMLDRIVRVECGRRIVAIKSVALSEDVFADHFIGRPIMPGAMMIESVAQAGTALIELTRRLRVKAVLVLVQNAKFRELVTPGDQLRIEAELISHDERTCKIDGVITVDAKPVMQAEMVFALHDADTIYLRPMLPVVYALYNVWLAGAETVGFEPPLERFGG
jgi:3-hydroxyacyl-[acyl-carrier-protein] dehydratase